MRRAALAALLFLGGCTTPADREVGMFVTGDIKNAEVIAAANGLTNYAKCLTTLEPIAMPSPNPKDAGIFEFGARAMAVEVAVYGPCGGVLAPILLRALGKAAGPFGIALPF